jgi:hypothetical protein
MKRTILDLFATALLVLCPSLKAQNSLEAFLDIGKTQVSEGLYSQISNFGCFEKAKWGIQGGYQIGLVQPQDVILNSWKVSPYGIIKIGSIPLDLGGEYLWTAFSPDLRVTNWTIFARTRLTHWQFVLGTNTRTYRLSHKAAESVGNDSRITEKWNVMYQVKYLLKPYENRWNLSGTFTNYDRFIIQQENNPMVNLRFDYSTSAHLSLYSELWYKQSGWMVIKVTYYGMFIRLGLLWKI